MNCDVIQDLLPLYHDGVASADSRKLVDEHLATCETCQKTLASMDEPVVTASPETEQPLVSGFRALRRRLRRRTVITAAIAAVCAIAIAAGAACGVFFYQWPVSYQKAQQVITQPVTSPIDLFTDKANFQSMHVLQRGDTLYISYMDTLWTSWTGKNRNPRRTQLDNVNTSDAFQKLITVPADVTKIYYLAANLDALATDEAAFEAAVANAVLLWQQ